MMQELFEGDTRQLNQIACSKNYINLPKNMSPVALRHRICLFL